MEVVYLSFSFMTGFVMMVLVVVPLLERANRNKMANLFFGLAGVFLIVAVTLFTALMFALWLGTANLITLGWVMLFGLAAMFAASFIEKNEEKRSLIRLKALWLFLMMGAFLALSIVISL